MAATATGNQDSGSQDGISRTETSSSRLPSTLTFTLETAPSSQSKFGPRSGRVVVSRPGMRGKDIEIETPGLLTGTSRGAVSHLAWDVYAQHASHENGVLKWVNVPWETFLEQNPPVPTLYAKHLASTSSAESSGPTEAAQRPLHSFLGFKPPTHILSMSPRDPNDTREMPPNQNDVLNVATLRGVRKLTPSEYTSHTHTLQPDIIFAPHDTPFTLPPYSQKRLTKSIDRTQGWIARLFNPQRNVVESVGKKGRKVIVKNGAETPSPASAPSAVAVVPEPARQLESHPRHAPILAPLLGSTSLPARTHYSSSLLEPLYGPELATIEPYKCVDEGVSGYFVELASVRRDIFENGESNRILDVGRGEGGQPNMPSHSTSNASASTPPVAFSNGGQLAYAPLLHASLSPLPASKPRIAFGINSPHELLRLVQEVGIDVVDAEWAIRLGSIGVGLDFAFPVPARTTNQAGETQIGHNLYSTDYSHDFTPVASSFTSSLDPEAGKAVCPCLSCSPRSFDGDAELIRHGVDSDAWISGETTATTDGVTGTPPGTKPTFNAPHTRAYIHHLLHTHEMSAHALLVSHNLAVVGAFLRGIRSTLQNAPETFEQEAARFLETYAEPTELVNTAAKDWRTVDVARGKGRLGREKDKGLGDVVQEAE